MVMVMTVNAGRYTVIYTEKCPPNTNSTKTKIKQTDTQTIAHLREMFSVKLKGKW